MTFPVSPKGFAQLDFDEIKKIATMARFEIRTHAKKKRSCGPGCEYLVQDKRYYTLLLLKHIKELVQTQTKDVAPEVLDWLDKARIAAREYEAIEHAMRPPVRTEK